ncbi:MAG TPA: putative motility protein [Candidatus Tenderia sp.]|nr:putative motility protein [Candidatus Tenderia sp.]
MDISSVLNPAVTQATRQKSGEAVSLAVLNKALDVEVNAAAELINSVAQPTASVPTEKLPPHLGRNLNVTA